MRFQAHESSIAKRLSSSLMALRNFKICREPATVPACVHLPEITRRSGDELVQLLAACAADLHWKAPGFGNLPEEVAKGLAVAEIVGPLGTFHDLQIRFGVLLQQPDRYYPRHRHEAEELYLVLSGRASWAMDDRPFVEHDDGAFIHHRPWQYHAMQTGSQPLLAIWGWVGGIGAPSYSL